jgi:Family of unknown function (DUF6441)
MKLAATIARSLQADMQAELRDLQRAVAAGTRDAGRGLKTELRRQVSSAGLGQRLANSWRDRHYPNRKLDAASLVYTKAPQIVRAFDEGAVIRSRRGRFLAIPTENAPRKGTDGKRISPSTFPEHRFGPLRFVPLPSGASLLVVDGLKVDVRFADTTLIDLAAGGTPVDLEFAYTLSALAKLVLTAHEVYLPKPKLAVEGPGGVQASFDFRGAKNTAAGRMLTVTLTNDLDGTVYA